MKYGFTLPSRGPLASPGNLSAIAKHGEDLGFHMMMFPDHIVMPRRIESPYPYTPSGVFPGTDNDECMEQLTTLTFLAGQTKTIRLVPCVMVVPHRSPVHTAKILATMDVLSGGRLTVGVGAGWLREEFEALQTPPFEDRGKVTDEYIQVFKELWTNDTPNYDGQYCKFSDITFWPKPIQKPHPPIWIGGESHRAMRRAAELGNGWQPVGTNNQIPLADPDRLQAAIHELRSYLARRGRTPESMEITTRMHGYDLRIETNHSDHDRPVFSGNAEQIASDIRRFEEMGVTNLVAAFGPTATIANSRDEMMRNMEALATKVWPQV
jgi:probable F420-dependent oxidoreductase